MMCSQVETEIIGFHFGLMEKAERDNIEVHLLSCPACLAVFFRHKRGIESSADAPTPSASLRARVRKAAAQALRKKEAVARTWLWWERPLAFAVAGLGVCTMMVATHAMTTGPGSLPHVQTRVSP
jgi:anti-sigma factor RsiW